MFDPPSLPAAGWYADPHVPGTERWWNGRDWEPEWRSVGAGHLAHDDLPEIGAWLRRAIRRTLLRWRSLVAIAALTSAPASVLIAIAVSRLVDGVVVTQDEVIGWSPDRLPGAITLASVGVVLSALGTLATVQVTLRTVDETPDPDRATAPSAGDELRSGVTAIGAAILALPRVVGWFTVLLLALAVIGVIVVAAVVFALPLGVLLLVAALPIGVYAAVRLAFLVQALVDRRGSPFGRSARVTDGRWWPTFGRLLLIGVIVWGVSAIVNTVASVLGTGRPGPFGRGGIEVTTTEGIDRVDLTELVPVDPVSITVAIVAAVVLNVCAAGLSGAAMGELYRTRNPAG